MISIPTIESRNPDMSTAKRLISAFAAVLSLSLAVGLGLAASSSAAPYTPAPAVSVSTSAPVAGGGLTVSGSGFGADDTVNLVLHTKAYSLGSATTDAAGAFSKTVQLPAGVTGSHTIVITDPTTGQTSSMAITIESSSSSGGASGGASGGSSGGGGLSNTGVAVLGIGGLGAALLLGGGVMLLAGRRRKVAV
jgi:hypothetical protein